jgi:transposase-like protein
VGNVSDGHGERLTRDQERAIAALLTSPTIGDAAGKLDVHANTLRAWMRDAEFAAAYAEARRELLENTVSHLQHAMFAVTDALVKDLSHKAASVRHRAAELLLDVGVRATDVLNLTRRVAGLEAALRDRPGDRRAGRASA